MPVSSTILLTKYVWLTLSELIIVTGLPCSGKTHRARQILENFQSRISVATPITLTPQTPNGITVQHLVSNHASLDISSILLRETKQVVPAINPRDLIYNAPREEKTARAEEFSTVKRALSKTNIVIADAPNYIKGFRYQLWCEAKAVGTRSIVLHAAAGEDECKRWNEDRIRAWEWTDFLTGVNDDIVVSSDNVDSDSKATEEFQPTSHTAIYGDKIPEELVERVNGSRSSSIDRGASDDETIQRRDKEEAMTLKSLYISDKRMNGDVDAGRSLDERILLPSTSEPHVNESRSPIIPTPSNPPPSKSGLPYAPSTLKSLSMRYEPPSPFTRWDTPLFTVPSSDIHPPYQAIWDALFPPPANPTKKVVSQLRSGEAAEAKVEEVRRHAATVLPKATGAEALQTLESATADVVKMLLAAARDRAITDGTGGDLLFSVPNPKTGNDISVGVTIPLNTALSQPVLQRLRRKYTQVQRGVIAHGQGYLSGRPDIVRDFCRFMEAEWNAE